MCQARDMGGPCDWQSATHHNAVLRPVLADSARPDLAAQKDEREPVNTAVTEWMQADWATRSPEPDLSAGQSALHIS